METMEYKIPSTLKFYDDSINSSCVFVHPFQDRNPCFRPKLTYKVDLFVKKMWNQHDNLDSGKYMLHQGGWENKSALVRRHPIHGHEIDRTTGRYGGSFPEARFPHSTGLSRGMHHQDFLDGNHYQRSPSVLGIWPPVRRHPLEEEFALSHGPQRHTLDAMVPYGDSYRDVDGYSKDVERRNAESNHYQEKKIQEPQSSGEPRKFGDFGHDRYSSVERHDLDDDDYYRRDREGSWDRQRAHSRYDNYDSDLERDSKERGRRKTRRDKESHWSRDREVSPDRGRRDRDMSPERGIRDRDVSPDRGRWTERSRSQGHDHHSRRSRSSSWGHGRGNCEHSYDEDIQNERRRVRDDDGQLAVIPSATLVVKGLFQKTNEDDLYEALVQWGPLRHVRVIRERNTGVSRGFAFIDFPSVEAACKMIDAVGESGLIVDGRRLFFEYSSKPTGGLGDSLLGPGSNASKGGGGSGGIIATVDWVCTMCGCMNFARRTSCFQCNEGRTDDAPSVDYMDANQSFAGKKGSESGATHVLVVRGLDENINEELLHYEFSKHAPIKDLRLVRDKFTHISRGFAFAHFHTVEDATKALESSNGATIYKSGQPLRVAYAKSVHGPPASTSSSTLAAAAIEAATFSQQYDAVGWAPKEYNPEQGSTNDVNHVAVGGSSTSSNAAAQQSGFVWDEASGYYYDAASGIYYDGHTGLYYDGNNGIWYTYNHATQQYEPYVDQTADKSGDPASQKSNGKTTTTKSNAGSSARKVVISAPPAMIRTKEQEAPEAKDKAKERERDLKLGPRNLLTSSKTKIQVDSTLALDDKSKASLLKTTTPVVTAAAATRKIQGVIHTNKMLNNLSANIEKKQQVNSGTGMTPPTKRLEGIIRSKDMSVPIAQSSLDVHGARSLPFSDDLHAENKQQGRVDTGMFPPTKKLEGIIRSKNLPAPTVVASLDSYGARTIPGFDTGSLSSGSLLRAQHTNDFTSATGGGELVPHIGQELEPGMKLGGLSMQVSIPFKTNVSALNTVTPAAITGGGRRRFSEAQTGYFERGVERRNF